MSCLYNSSEGSIHMLISQQLFDHQEAGRFTYSSSGLEAVSMGSTILCKVGNMVQCQEDVGKGYAGAVFHLKMLAYHPLSVHSTMLIYKDQVSMEDATWTIALAIAVTYVPSKDKLILFLKGSWTGCGPQFQEIPPICLGRSTKASKMVVKLCICLDNPALYPAGKSSLTESTMYDTTLHFLETFRNGFASKF